MYKQIKTAMPEPSFRCAGADSIIEHLYENHPEDEYAQQAAIALFYADIIDEECQQEASGFFCQDCLEAYDLVVDERLTLLSAIRERVADATTAATGFRDD